MNVQPKRSFDGALRPVMWNGAGVVIECEVMSPASMKGRTTYLHLDGETLDQVLLELRDKAIHNRRTTEPVIDLDVIEDEPLAVTKGSS